MRVKSDLEFLKKKIVKMKRQTTIVEEQHMKMEKGKGLSLLPKPTLHSMISMTYI